MLRGTVEERARALRGADRARSPGLGMSRPRTPDKGSRSSRMASNGQRAVSEAERPRDGRRAPSASPRGSPGHAERELSERDLADEWRQTKHVGAERMTKSGASWRGGWEGGGCTDADGDSGGRGRRHDDRPRVPHSVKAGNGSRWARARLGEAAPDAHSPDDLKNGRLTHDSVGSIVQKQNCADAPGGPCSEEWQNAKLEEHPRGGAFYNMENRERSGAGGRKPKKHGGRAREPARGAASPLAADRRLDRGLEANDLNFNPARESSGSPDMFSPTKHRADGKSREAVVRSGEQDDGAMWSIDSRARTPERQRRAEPLGVQRQQRGHVSKGFNPVKSAPDLPRSPYSRREERPRSPGQYPPGARSPSPFELLKTAPDIRPGSSLTDVQDIMGTNDMMRSADLRWDFLQSTDVCWDLNSRDAEKMTPGLQARWTDSGRPGVRHRCPSTGAQPVTPPSIPKMPSKTKPKAGFIAKMLAGCCRPDAMYEVPDRAEVPQQRRPSFLAQRRPPPEREPKELQRFASRQKFMVSLIEEDRLRPAGSGRGP
eukprot:evm.model.scf_1087.1 EVM.evm.TU.scf_1087.1   scf_1087:7859-11226(-)